MTFGLHLTLGALCLVADLSVGVAPFSMLGLEEEQGAVLRRVAMERVGSQRRGRQVVAPATIDAAILELELGGEALQSCLQEGPCAARVARQAQADQLIVGSAAGLGRTYMLRLNLVDAQRGVIAEEVQQSVEGDLSDLSAAVSAQVDRLLGPPPVTRRWWFWTIIGGVVVAAAAITAVVLFLPDDPQVPTYPLP